jgi:hypothetical protein
MAAETASADGVGNGFADRRMSAVSQNEGLTPPGTIAPVPAPAVQAPASQPVDETTQKLVDSVLHSEVCNILPSETIELLIYTDWRQYTPQSSKAEHSERASMNLYIPT